LITLPINTRARQPPRPFPEITLGARRAQITDVGAATHRPRIDMIDLERDVRRLSPATILKNTGGRLDQYSISS
jgi:hypothetical protein